MASPGEHQYVVPSTTDGLGWDGDFAAAVAGAGAVAEPASPPGAACSSLGHYGRSPLPPGAVAGTLRRRDATLSASSTATSAAGVLHYLRRTRRCTGWCSGLTPPTTRTQGCHAQGCQAHGESLARTGLPGPAGWWPYLGSGPGLRAGIALDSLSRHPRSAEGVPGGPLRHYVATVCARRNACRGDRVWDRGSHRPVVVLVI